MGRRTGFLQRIRSLMIFSRCEQRGILWLLPLLAMAALVLATANRPSFETSFLELANDRAGNHPDNNTNGMPQQAEGNRDGELFLFDPNTATLQELCLLGFTPRTAAGIIKYRQRGKRFEIPEDFATCYGVTLEDYDRLEPYITIGEQYKRDNTRTEQRQTGTKTDGMAADKAALHSFDPNSLDAEGFRQLGFSAAQAAVIIKYRESIGGFRSKEDLAHCYVVSDEIYARLEPYIEIALPQKEANAPKVTAEPAAAYRSVMGPIELNRADSAALRSVSGIGETLVARIIEYRRRLGGFHRIEQLAEIKGMTEANYERICEQIWVDSCEIQKIDINFASHKKLAEQFGSHPYTTDKMLRRLLKQRQLKGGWSTPEQLVRENIMNKAETVKLAPYLVFEGD